MDYKIYKYIFTIRAEIAQTARQLIEEKFAVTVKVDSDPGETWATILVLSPVSPARVKLIKTYMDGFISGIKTAINNHITQ